MKNEHDIEFFDIENKNSKLVLIKSNNVTIGAITDLYDLSNGFHGSQHKDWRVFDANGKQISSLYKEKYNDVVSLTDIKNKIKEIGLEYEPSVNHYVIEFKTAYGFTYYFDVDHNSGGYPCLKSDYSKAKSIIDLDKAKEIHEKLIESKYQYCNVKYVGDEIVSSEIIKVGLME